MVGVVAGLLAAMIRHEPARAPRQIARLARVNGDPRSVGDEERSLWLIPVRSGKPDNLNRLIGRLIQRNPDEGRQVVSSMVGADATYCKMQLPFMIQRHNPAFADELLRQLASQDPHGPWMAITSALIDSNFKVAIDIAEKAPSRVLGPQSVYSTGDEVQDLIGILDPACAYGRIRGAAKPCP